MNFTEQCLITTGTPTTTQNCYNPTDVFYAFFIEYLIVAIILCLGIYLFKITKSKLL